MPTIQITHHCALFGYHIYREILTGGIFAVVQPGVQDTNG
jgi:hypothetical protein